MNSSYVYFITDDNGHIKIGKADDVYTRLCTLQTGNPYKLRILLSIPTENMQDAFLLEQKLHHLFAKDRMEGEWFHASAIIDFLSEEVCQVDKFRFLGRGPAFRG